MVLSVCILFKMHFDRESKTMWVTISSQSLIPEPQNDKDQANKAWWQNNSIKIFSARKYECLHDFQSFDTKRQYIKYICQKCLEVTHHLPYMKQNQKDTFSNPFDAYYQSDSKWIWFIQWKYKDCMLGMERLQTMEESLSVFNIKRCHFIYKEKIWGDFFGKNK